MKTRILCLCGGFLFLLQHNTVSQIVAKKPSVQAVRTYFDKVSSFSPLYFGKAAFDYGRQIEYPYFISPDFSAGQISYDGVEYDDVMLRLDLSRNELSVLPPGGLVGVVIYPQRIKEVYLHGYRIVPVSPKDALFFGEEGNFLIEFFRNADNSLRGLCTIIKKPVETKAGGTVSLNFLTKNKYYIEKENRFFEIRRKQNLPDCFPEQQKEVTRYMKSLDLRYSDDPALYIGKLLEQINNK